MASNTLGAAVSPAQSQGRKFTLNPSEGWGTVILAVVLVMITVAAIQSFNWTAHIGILTSTTLVGCALGFILAKQRVLPQSLADIPALAIGILFALYQTANVDKGGDIGALIANLGSWVQVAASSGNSTDDSIFLLFLSVLTMLLGYVTMWLIFRSRSPWLAAIANAIVLLINLNYETEDKFLFAVLFMLVTLLLLVRFNLVEHMRTWRSKGLRFSPEIGWDFMQVGVIFAIAVMLFSVILPSINTNGTLASIWNSPDGPWSFVQNKFSQVFSIAGGSDNGRVAFGNSLAIQGSVNLPATVQFTYTTNDTQNSFFEAVTFDHFTGSVWTVTPPQKVNAIPANDTQLYPESNVVNKVTQTIHMVNVPADNYIFAAGEPGAFSLPVNAYSDGILLSSNDNIGSYTSWQTPQAALKPGMVYSATSFASAATAAELSAVPSPSQDTQHTLYSQQLLARYTQLPADLQNDNNRVRQTANLWTSEASTMYDKIVALVNGFRSSSNGFQYSTTPGAPGPDSALTLLQNKKGYCTWYASGFVMMARSLGIPARVAEGFAPGSIEPKTPGAKTVRGTDAHMWAQVYFPGYGWINFEPSTGDQFSGLATLQAKPIAGADNGGGNDLPPPPKRGVTTTPKPPVGTTTSTTTKTSKTTPVNPVVQGVAISLSLLIALILLAILGIIAWWRLIFRGLTPISQTFARMALLGRFAGVKPQAAQTASEYGEALSSRIPAHKAAINEITDLYVYERWAPAVPNATPTLGERWRELRADLVRATVRRWPRRRSRHETTNL